MNNFNYQIFTETSRQHGEQIFVEASRKRIRDRNIPWKETYGKRSLPLKKRFDNEIGPGAYWRWEGHDITTNSDYFVIVGPAVQKNGKKAFFSGIKKMPPLAKRKDIYAPSGKYFPTIMSAINHAHTMWGINYPKGQIHYTVQNLIPIDIPRHVKGIAEKEYKYGEAE